MNYGKRFSLNLDMAGKLFTDISMLLLFIGLFMMATGNVVNVNVSKCKLIKITVTECT